MVLHREGSRRSSRFLNTSLTCLFFATIGPVAAASAKEVTIGFSFKTHVEKRWDFEEAKLKEEEDLDQAIDLIKCLIRGFEECHLKDFWKLDFKVSRITDLA